MQYPAQQLKSRKKKVKRTFRLTAGEVVGLMWGVTACWVVIGLLTPGVSRNATVICGTVLIVSPTCCLHIGLIVGRQIKALRIENSSKLDGLLGIATAFAAGRITERQLHEDRADIKARILDNVIYLDQKRLRPPVPPTPPEGWSPPEDYDEDAGAAGRHGMDLR